MSVNQREPDSTGGSYILVRPAPGVITGKAGPATIEAFDVEGEITLEEIHRWMDLFCHALVYRDNPRDSDGVTILADDDGNMKKLPMTMIRPTDGWPLVGPLMVCRIRGSRLLPLTQQQFHDWWGALSVLGYGTTEVKG